MLDRVLRAVPDARPRVVVGPDQTVPGDVTVVREDPPMGGPAAAIAAGVRAIRTGTPDSTPRFVAVLAGDQPLLTVEAVERLLAAARTGVATTGAVYAADARPQLLCGVWRFTVLAQRCAELGGPSGITGMSVRRLLGTLDPVPVEAPSGTPPPWYDCDTPDEVERADSVLTRRQADRDGSGPGAEGES